MGQTGLVVMALRKTMHFAQGVPRASSDMVEQPSVRVLSDEPSGNGGSESYVSYVLRHEKVRPDVTWSNWWREAQWGRFTLIMIMPPLAAISACFTPLQRETAIWSVMFYVMSGMGM